MDFRNLAPDETLLIDRHYTPGRDGVYGVVLHHNAANLSIRDCYDVWRNREASAHYQVDAHGRIGRLVNDCDTAWACGSEWANRRMLSIENANDHIGEPWTIGAATLDAGAHLTAALCRYYGLGAPEWLVNVFPHSYFSPTGCPGEIAGSQREEYMRRARWYYDNIDGRYGDDDMLKEELLADPEGGNVNAGQALAWAHYYAKRTWRTVEEMRGVSGWDYTNERVNGDKDAYGLLTDAANGGMDLDALADKVAGKLADRMGASIASAVADEVAKRMAE